MSKRVRSGSFLAGMMETAGYSNRRLARYTGRSHSMIVHLKTEPGRTCSDELARLICEALIPPHLPANIREELEGRLFEDVARVPAARSTTKRGTLAADRSGSTS